MKQIVTAALIGLGLYSSAAMAADGQITVTGNIVAQTCNIAGNSGQNVTVTLPTVGAASLAAKGQTSGATPFAITLSNCPSALKNAQTRFEVGPTVNATTGNLLNATGSGAASNVEVQLLNNSFNAINLSNNANSQVVPISSGGASMAYYAQYYATGAAGAGSVNTSVQYSMTYQ
ncbi:fimbrial protein [Chromobacterium sinusclupearum]|jgi:major type 1 subunit fimbrin (pilin)|uniref:Fimbrial protein n=1 Tax=Chromobacterium sinusclupearum TaxID=2077146 RepID=A0A2K4ML93_9NEIS|nr:MULTISPECIES: fimbrial protein [Chromobacterium]POA97769.1 fimbrial protein [Chromobacterium sinusclupearum]